MIVYISGKYSGNVAENVARAKAAALDLLRRGFAPLCPHTMYDGFDADRNQIISADLELLRRCDAILMLEGWNKSEGALLEYQFAQEHGIPIFYSVVELENEFHNRPARINTADERKLQNG